MVRTIHDYTKHSTNAQGRKHAKKLSPSKSKPTKSINQETTLLTKAKMTFRTMADVSARVGATKWLVDGWVPFGYLTVIIADNGIGKSFFAMAGLAEPIVNGGTFFDNPKWKAKKGPIIWFDTEGSAGLTAERMKRFGVDQSRVIVFGETDELDSMRIDDPKDLDRLEDMIDECKPQLVVIDSLSGSHQADENDARIKKPLKSLVDIAERTGVAMVLIHHTKKLDVDRAITKHDARGSSAITQFARSVIMIDKPNAALPELRVLQGKNSFLEISEPFGFAISGTKLIWGEAPQPARSGSMTQLAMDWLSSRLTPGEWVPSKQIEKEAKEQGYSEKQLHSAKVNLKIKKPDNVVRRNNAFQIRLPCPALDS
ncbi:AAA family ATPase [Neorhodopirellula lusitana]|uniref:AAA family ATPase n=1 Tax=Neorhodopirellula lusitana TaxID=445327 RepID=UPI00384F6371